MYFSLSHSLHSLIWTIADASHQRYNPSQPLSTPLTRVSSSIDFATRIAKILARRTGKPAYVGSSATFAGATVEEEVAGVTAVVEGVMRLLGEERREGEKMVNGVNTE